jgi:hypothetical protein
MDFNQWRGQYDTLTFEQQQEYHSELEALYPDQAHYDLDAAKKAFEIVKPAWVIEAGAWKGNLAAEILSKSDCISQWYAFELCPAAIARTVCNDVRFRYASFNTFNWWVNNPLVCDLFIATHFIEHLSFAHLSEMIKSVKSKHIYFEAPLTDSGENWDNFHGTHKLEVGWSRVSEWLLLHGYKKIDITNHCKLFERG